MMTNTSSAIAAMRQATTARRMRGDAMREASRP